MSDKVNHPSHYNQEGKKECIEEMIDTYGELITGIFCLTNAFKYLYRMGNKIGESDRDDFQKAQWYQHFYGTRIGAQLTNDSGLADKVRLLASDVGSKMVETRKRLEDNYD